MKVVRLSALRTGRLYPPGNIPGTHFCQRLSQPRGHSAAGRIISMKNSDDTIGNRTRDLPDCSAVPQPTAPPRAPSSKFLSPKGSTTTAAAAVPRTVLTFVKYVGCFLDTVQKDPLHLYNNCTKRCLHFNHIALLTPHQLCTTVTNLVWYPDDGPLQTETWNIHDVRGSVHNS